MCCHMPGVRRQGGGVKNEDVRCSAFGHGHYWDSNPTLPPGRPEQELGSMHANRIPLQFPEICGVDSGLGHRGGEEEAEPTLMKSSRAE